MRIQSGSISTSGTNGRKLTPVPASTSSSGAATPTRGATVVAAAIARSPRTTTISDSRQGTTLYPFAARQPVLSRPELQHLLGHSLRALD